MQAAPQVQALWDETFGPNANSDYAGKVYFIATNNWSGINYPYSTALYSQSGGFGNGYIPLFGIVGKDNVVYYNDNGVGAVSSKVKKAIESFYDISIENPIDDVTLDLGTSIDIDLSNVFVSGSGAEISYEVIISEQNILTGSINGSTLTLTAGSNIGTVAVELKGTAGGETITDEFIAKVVDPNATDYWVEYGVNYSFDGAVGVGNAPWGSAITWDFGETEVKINEFEVGYSNAENNLTWKVTEYDGSTPNNDNVIGDLTGTFNANAGEGTIITVSSAQTISGKVAFIFESAGNYMALDKTTATNPEGNWAYSDNAWAHLSEFNFDGNWYIRAHVSLTSGIESEIIPGSTTLAQNYPNPFNPETTISFRNTMSGMVNLSVFNSNGELVKELVNGKMLAGNHSVSFNALNLNAGVYFYTLTTPNASLTKKMVLIK